MPLSLDDFARQLTDCGLFSADEMASLRSGSHAAGSEQFARELVKQKKLTAYQAQVAYSGKAKSLVLGNYVIQDKLGQGGMGMVLKAQHRRMKRTVALKVLSPTVTKTKELVGRFVREVQAAARLEHPNIVAAYDADEAHGTHFLVMQYVEGKDLSTVVKSRGPLPVDQGVNCILQAAHGLEYAHKRGIIHRDIKPANLLLDAEGNVKVLDMGLARIEGETGTQAELTNTGAIMGTIDYMPPEQALNTKSADARSDIYSLGMTLWYLLVGKPAFEGDSLMARMLAHREAPIPSLSAALGSPGNALPGSISALDAIFRKMVAKNAVDRYQSMTEVIAALEGCLRGEAPPQAAAVSLGGSEDSRFSAFIAGLEQTDAGSHAVASRRIKTRSATIELSEPAERTISISASDAQTDPKTLHSLVRKPKRKPVWWQDRTVQIGGGIAAVVLVVGSFLFLPKSAKKSEISDRPSVPPRSSTDVSNPSVKTAEPERSTNEPARVFDSEQWISLFDGYYADAGEPRWRSLGPFRIENRLLVSSTAGLAISEEEFENFELEFEWKISEGGNSGVYYRNPANFVTAAAVPGIEYQLLDNDRHPNGKSPATRTASLYGLIAPSADVTHTIGQFNESRIVANGTKVEHWLNGTKVLSYDSSDPGFRSKVQATQFAGRFPSQPLRGPIALQGHTGTVSFRRIRVRAFTSSGQADTKPAKWLPPKDRQNFGGHSYYFFRDQMTWKEAKARCEEVGGHLVMIESARENKFVGKLIEDAGGMESWIGMTDEVQEGKWLWVDGKPIEWTNWYAGNPNNKGNIEHYGVMAKRIGNSDIGWKWSDQPNQPTQLQPGYVCEWDAPVR